MVRASSMVRARHTMVLFTTLYAVSAGAISLGASAATIGRHDLASCSRHLTRCVLPTRRLSTPLLCASDGEGASDGEDRLFGLPRKEVAQPLGLLLFSQLVLFVGVGAVILPYRSMASRSASALPRTASSSARPPWRCCSARSRAAASPTRRASQR